MAFRQILTLLIWPEVLQTSPLIRRISEIPGYIVTLLPLTSIIYIGLILKSRGTGSCDRKWYPSKENEGLRHNK